ncbi:MAG: hypothetical protein HY057_13925 [Rhodospirillales bacterium]|nr:hypothetical protein [Rhodospirillales bacterium]
MRRLIGEQSGNVGIFAALLATAAIAGGTLAVDFGRLAVLKGQMQHRADAGALAGAVQLDGRAGARDRARRVAIEAVVGRSNIPKDGTELTVSGVTFYQTLTPAHVAADTDENAVFVEVSLAPKQVDVLFQPLMNFLVGKASATTRQLNATAVARPDPFICHAPPLMMCDLAELDPALDLTLPGNAGRQVRLKEPVQGGGSMAPGNFGLLSLPDGSAGANDIQAALAAVAPEDCYTLDLTTATGSKTQKVRAGLNARFDLPGGLPNPAPNVINYPRDDSLNADANAKMGAGVWNLNTYWQQKHGGAPPAALAEASRYQVYLYELGYSYARSGRRTVYPVGESVPAGFVVVTPPGPSVPVAANQQNKDDPNYDGVPSRPVASNGHARRLLAVPLLACVAENVHGRGTYPSHGKYVEMFVTEMSPAPPDAGIYAEVVRALTPSTSVDFHANARLVQ